MCNNCIHKPVCSKYIATGGVKSCEHHKEERKGRWEERYMPNGEYADSFIAGYRCSNCNTTWDCASNYCPNCGADMRGG